MSTKVKAMITCAGCGDSAGPFGCALKGVCVQLCERCARRLLVGESKAAVINTVNIVTKKAA